MPRVRHRGKATATGDCEPCNARLRQSPVCLTSAMSALRNALMLAALTLIGACKPQTAASTLSVGEPSFSARVDDQPYRAQTRDVCMLNHFNLDERAQFMFSFARSEHDDALHLGLARGDDQPGPRDITYVLANLGDASFSGVREGSAEITGLTRVADGWLVSGRFALALSGSSMASGQPETRQLAVTDAHFEHIHCLDPVAIAPPTGAGPSEH